MTCNIDAKGKLVRFIYGIVFLLAGFVLMIFWAMSAQTIVAWAVSILLMLIGALAVFAARSGWCIVRAMGFKTPI